MIRRAIGRSLTTLALVLALVASAPTAQSLTSSGGSVEVQSAPVIDDSLSCRPAQGVPTTYDYGDAVGWRVIRESVPDDTIWSGHAVPQAIAAHGSTLYVAYYDADRRMTIAKRTAPDAPWTTVPVHGVDAVVGWDSHNLIAMAVDAEGNLHVAGNMHGDPIRYWRTMTAGDLSTLQRMPPMVDPVLQTAVTYPVFFRRADGSLMFHYREGGSGDGVSYMARYDTASRSWSLVADSPIFDGRDGSIDRSVYFKLSDEPNSAGFFEMTWVWRDTPDAATNSRLSYMRSRDLVHWETVGGTPLQLPIRYDTPGVIVDDIPSGGGILNGAARLIETQDGTALIAYYKFDEAGNHQIYAAVPAIGNRWRVEQLTHWRGRVQFSGNGTLRMPLHITGGEPTPRGDVRIDFICAGEARRDASLVVELPQLRVVAETPPPRNAYPTQIYRNVPTDSQATVGAGTVLETRNDRVVMMRWQSQGTNADRPFPQVSPPLPLRVYDVRPISNVDAPRRLIVAATRNQQQYALSWERPAGASPEEVAGYLIEYSPDRGESWITTQQTGQLQAIATAHGDARALRFRVSAMSADGVGQPIVAEVSTDEPSQSPPSPVPADPWWQPSPIGVVAAICAVGLAVLLLRPVLRSRQPRHRR